MPFWAPPPFEGATDTIQEVFYGTAGVSDGPTAPSMQWLLDEAATMGLDTPVVCYSLLSRWSQLVLPAPAGVPQYVRMEVGQDYTPPPQLPVWIESVPPFNGMGPLSVTYLEVAATGQSTNFRFGPSGASRTVAEDSSVVVPIPVGQVLVVDENSRLQFQGNSLGAATVTITYTLA